ncbi:MAG: MotA/TolQ/ExbB proton channel family protein [Polyangia bacterium]
MKPTDFVQQVLLRSGTAWVLWTLGGLSIVTVGIIIERWLFLRARDCEPQALARSIRPHLVRRHFAAAAQELGKTRSVAAAVAAAGLQLAALGPAAVEKSMQSAVAIERGLLERWLAYLGTVGNNAPFIGLFGTVVGVIGAFEQLGHGAAQGAGGAAGQLASQAVMTSIAEALVATAAGILVALPAVAAFNYFQRRIAALLLTTDALANLVIAYVADGRATPAGDVEAGRGP